MPLTIQELKEVHSVGVSVILPSGLTARVRPVDEYAVLNGDLPDVLTQTVWAAFSGASKQSGDVLEELVKANEIKDDAGREKALQKITQTIYSNNAEVIKSSLAMQEAVARLSLVYPRIVDQPVQDDEISYAMLPSSDKSWLWEVYNKPLAELRRFCEEQTQVMATLSDGDNLPPATESDSDGG